MGFDSNGCWMGNWCQDKSEGGCPAPHYGENSPVHCTYYDQIVSLFHFHFQNWGRMSSSPLWWEILPAHCTMYNVHPMTTVSLSLLHFRFQNRGWLSSSPLWWESYLQKAKKYVLTAFLAQKKHLKRRLSSSSWWRECTSYNGRTMCFTSSSFFTFTFSFMVVRMHLIWWPNDVFHFIVILQCWIWPNDVFHLLVIL